MCHLDLSESLQFWKKCYGIENCYIYDSILSRGINDVNNGQEMFAFHFKSFQNLLLWAILSQGPKSTGYFAKISSTSLKFSYLCFSGYTA